MKSLRAFIPIILLAMVFSSCNNVKEREEREKFVKDSIENAEKEQKARLETELFGDLYLGMSKDEVLNAQVFKGSVMKEGFQSLDFENKQGFDIGIDSLYFKLNNTRVFFTNDKVDHIFVFSETNKDYRKILNDVGVVERSICRKYDFKYDKYKLMMVSESHFSPHGFGYPCRKFEYGDKEIEILLKKPSSDDVYNYSYVISVQNLFLH